MPAPYDTPQYGSDVMADAMAAMNFRYVSLNPGSSFRGLHDSLVNYGDNGIEMIECPHEKLAVGLAHGYAKASGNPMAVILHNVVGLLHSAMAIYYAYIDRVPVVIFGGSGPAAYDRRRPNIDWIHGANVQGNAVRDYTKWDYEPRSVKSVPSSIARARRIAASEPSGPVYVALDAGLQEEVLDHPVPMPDFERLQTPSKIGPDPAALQRLAAELTDARRPVIIPGFVGRDPRSFDNLVKLAEMLGIGIHDPIGVRHNFPNRHPLCITGTDALESADCVLFLDVKDMGKPTQILNSTTRTVTSRLAANCKVLDLGFNDIEISSWSEDYSALFETDVQVTGDSSIALPMLLEICAELTKGETAERKEQRTQYRDELERLHDDCWLGWRVEAEKVWDQSPVSTPRLAAEIWEVIKDEDWVLTGSGTDNWAKRTWDFDRSYRHHGSSLGTATQIGLSLGMALAHKGTGRLVVDVQPDGDLMFDAGALWVAAYYKLPLLVVMFNNRAYYNDWAHQERIAVQRGTDIDKAYLGMELNNPAPDFAALARSFSWHAEGPIADPDEVQDAVRRAVEYIERTGLPALVDVICQPK